MKKLPKKQVVLFLARWVNWSKKQEVIGATKVVILFVILMSIMLFLVDSLFMLFFSEIGVLKV